MISETINNVILILILLLLANYLSNGSILLVIKKYYQLLIDYLTEKFNLRYEHDIPVCSLAKKENNSTMKELNSFLQTLVSSKKIESIPSSSKEMFLTQKEHEIIRKYLIRSLKSNDFKFNNVTIIDKLIYYVNSKGKEMKPFRFISDVYDSEDEPIGKLTISVEMFFRMDDLFEGPINAGFPTITRIKINHKDEIEEMNETEYEEDKKESDNDLIPDSVHFSTDEKQNDDKESSISIPEIETTSINVTSDL